MTRADLRLRPNEAVMLAGDEGPGVAMAMRVVTALARVRGAEELVPVTSAHVDSCLYHGRSGLDFATRLINLGARVRIPTTLNVGAVDLLHPGTVRASDDHPELVTDGADFMTAYAALGARPTYTCAPTSSRPVPGSGNTSPGRSRTPLSSPTRCSAPAPTATATSSTSVPP